MKPIRVSAAAPAVALMLVAAAGLAAAAPCEKKGPYELKGSGNYDKARAEALTSCMNKIQSLSENYEYVKPCTSACGGTYISLDNFKGGSGGSFQAAYQCCLELGPGKGGQQQQPQQQQQKQNPAPAPTPAPTPAPAPKAMGAGNQQQSSGGGGGGAGAMAAALGGWSGPYTCDVAGSWMAANSILSVRAIIKNTNGKLTIMSREQLTQPNFGCRYEWEGTCEPGPADRCSSGTTIMCKATAHPVWDGSCGGVEVPKFETFYGCAEGNNLKVLEISPTCSRAEGTWSRGTK